MKKLLIIGTFLFSSAVLSQDKISFTAIDQRILKVKTSDAATLSKELTSGYTSDLEKVRAIFRWITENISYKVPTYSRHPPARYKKRSSDTDTSALKSADERAAENVLEDGETVCDGYTKLFKTLCVYAGLKAEVVVGFARGSKGARRFGSNHTWNVVMIDNKWELMDVTWASGYISYRKDEFIKEFDENYFMAKPEKFIEEHYPDNLHWTLMDDPPLMAEFRNSPYKQKTFSKYSINAYSPAKGLLEVKAGDTLRFELESTNIERDHNIFSDLFPGTAVFQTDNSILLCPSSRVNNKTTYTYLAASPQIKWLYLLYNDDVILRYRIVVQPEKKDVAAAGGSQ